MALAIPNTKSAAHLDFMNEKAKSSNQEKISKEAGNKEPASKMEIPLPAASRLGRETKASSKAQDISPATAVVSLILSNWSLEKVTGFVYWFITNLSILNTPQPLFSHQYRPERF